MKKIISYFLPKVRRLRSDINGVLEIYIADGVKYLDSKNANYSYGSLHRVMDFGLSKVFHKDMQKVLLLGLGGGSAIRLLREKYNFSGVIAAIDLDPLVIELAETEFGISPDKRTEVYCEDAFEYVRMEQRKFDLAIVDLFIDDRVPDKFYSEEFWKNLAVRVNDSGAIFFNSMKTSGEHQKVFTDYLISNGFEVGFFPGIQGSNLVCLASRKIKSGRR